MSIVKLEVSKTVTDSKGVSSRENVGAVDIYVPALKDFGLDVEPTGAEKDGSPIYAAKEHAWLANAILAAAKAQARNKLKSGTTELRAGATIAMDLESLVTPSENTGNALADRRDLIASFKDWMAAKLSDKPEALRTLLRVFLEKPETLVAQPLDKRQKIKVYFENFGNDVAEKLTDYQATYLDTVLAKCDEEEVEF